MSIAAPVRFFIEVELDPNGTPTEWRRLGGFCKSVESAQRSLVAHKKTPGGYGRKHRIVDQAGNEYEWDA
jgi:hypothetical protein